MCAESNTYITNILNRLILPRLLHVLYTCHAHTACFATKMVRRGEEMCSSCFECTKYRCLRCINFFCMWCFVFENDENIAGWKAGSSVAYCKPCFQEKMTTEMNLGEMEGNDQEADFPNQTSRRKSQEAIGQSTKPHSLERYEF